LFPNLKERSDRARHRPPVASSRCWQSPDSRRRAPAAHGERPRIAPVIIHKTAGPSAHEGQVSILLVDLSVRLYRADRYCVMEHGASRLQVPLQANLEKLHHYLGVNECAAGRRGK
jgi:hypothetical protein